jgi:hypothetical protein
VQGHRSAPADIILGPLPLLHGCVLFGAPQNRFPFEPENKLQTPVVFFRAHGTLDEARARLDHAGRIERSTSFRVIALLRLPVALSGPHRQNVMMPR